MSTDERKSVIKVVAEDGTKEAFNEIKQGAKDTAQVVSKAGVDAAKGIGQIGEGVEKTSRKLEAFEKSWVRDIQRVLVATEAGEKGTAKYFETWGKFRGIGADVLEPVIAQLKAAEAAQAAATKGLGNMGVSAAQTAAALRQVPAQFTDIVVSLQGGMNPLTVFLQQGGQLKDMFGSAGAAAKALGGYVIGLVNPLTVAAAGAAALALAYHQGTQENDAFIRSIVLTGNASGVTANQLREYARQMSAVAGTQSQAASGLADFVAAGVRGGDELRRYTQTAVEWEKITGQSVSKTADQFASLQKDPLAAVLKLNEGANFLTVSVYEQIKALEDQGRKADASKVAMDALDGAMRDRAKTIKESLGYIEAGWAAIKRVAAGAWDSMLNVGRQATVADQLADVRRQLAVEQRRLDGAERSSFGGSRETKAQELRIRATVEALKAQETQIVATMQAEEKAAAAKAEGNRVMQALAEFDKKYEKALEKETTLQEKLTQARNEGAAAGKNEADMKAVLAWVTEEHNKANKGSAAAARAAKKELADQARVYADLAGLSSTYYADLARGQKELAKGVMTQAQYVKYVEDLIKKQPFAIALAKEEEKARRELQKAIEDDIRQADRVADKRQAAIKSVEDALLKARQEEEAHALAASANITLAEATERLTIARLEDHLAQARAGAESQATIDALERELRARKELQTVLQQKGVREANKKATEEAAKDWDKTAQTISRTLSDYIMAGGKNAAQYLKRLFATLVLEPVVQTAVSSVLGVGKTALNGASSGGSALDLLGTGKTATSAVSSGTMFMNGLSAWGAEGSVVGMFSNPGLYTGMELAGAAAPPLLAAYAAYKILSGDWFGSRGANHAGAAYSTAGLGNDKSAEALFGRATGDWYDDLTSRYSAGLEKQLGTSVDALSGVYKSLAKYAGDSAKQIDIVAGFASNPKHGDEDSYGYFKLIDKITGNVLKDYTARDGVLGTDPKAAYEKYIGEMGGALISELKAADIPGWMRSIFNDVGDVVTVDGLNKALTAIAAVDSVFKGWADTLKGFASLSAEAQTSLIKTSGGIDALAGNVNAFYSGFYSEAERMGILQRQVLQQLASLDVSVDTSSADAAKESFRKTVEGALDAGNAELAAKLLAMSGSFATAADYAAKAAEEAVQAASKAMESLLSDRRQLEAELLKAQGNTSGYAAAMRAIATEGYTPAEVAAYDYNAALRDQIDAMTAATAAAERAASERAGLETRLLNLQGDTAALRQRELAALDASNRALQEHIWAIEDAQAAYTAATTAAQGAYSGLERSVGAQKSVLQEQYNAQKAALQEQANAAKEAWQAQVSAAQTAASEMRSIASMLGNAFDNVQIQSPALSMARLQSAQSLIIGARDRNDVRVAGLDEALQVASGDTAKMYGKWEEWAFQQGVTAAAVGDLYGEAQKQLSAQEQLIAQLQASDVVAKAISDAEMAKTDAWYQQELGVIDATLETGKSQLNALLGIDDSVLSVADAVAKLSMSISAAEAARAAAAAAKAALPASMSSNPSDYGDGGSSGAAGTAVSYTDEQLRAMGLDPAAVNAQYNWLKSNGATNAVGPGELVQSMLTSGQAALQGILNTQTNTDKFGNVYKDYADFLGKFTDAQIIQASKIATLPDGVNREDYLRDILAKSINGSHADGLSYVPFDGYIAELHKGERVMTADENRLYTPNFAAVNSGAGVIDSLRAEIATLRTLLAEISANTNATAGWTAATDRKLNRVVRNDAIATITT